MCKEAGMVPEVKLPAPVGLEGLTLHVRDVEVSRAFYEQLPGAELVGHRPAEFALFRIGDFLLGLLGVAAPGFHLEVATDDLDGLHAHFKSLGVKTSGPPRVRPWGERTFNVRDPDGNSLEFQDG
jgi:catechol 2,3-dioxygenase-like lactoylglutathione lyase family enzyme